MSYPISPHSARYEARNVVNYRVEHRPLFTMCLFFEIEGEEPGAPTYFADFWPKIERTMTDPSSPPTSTNMDDEYETNDTNGKA